MDGDGFEVAARKVAPLLWSEDCCLGVPALDADHQLLFELVGTFINYPDPVPANVVNVLLGSLREYAALHFDREEAWQREIGYPGLVAHRAPVGPSAPGPRRGPGPHRRARAASYRA